MSFAGTPARMLTAALVFMVLSLSRSAESQILDVGKSNLEAIVAQYDVVFVNFYAEWCKFSRMLAPIFEETAKKITEEYPGNKVALARIDCDKEADVCAAYHISKYPSLKLWRSGQVSKREYRGQRTQEAFLTHLREQLKDPILPINGLQDTESPDKKQKRSIVLYFHNNQAPYWHTVRRMAAYVRDECPFYVWFGSAAGPNRGQGDAIVFREKIGTTYSEDVYHGDLNDANALNQWTYDRCVPLVREITFENAEEMTEEGLPFLILFHKQDDVASGEIYKQEIRNQLMGERRKATADLPLIAVDSFRHMYLFPNFRDITIPGKLKQFIDDLHSGKLHRVFHYGFDPNESSTLASIDATPAPGGHIPVNSGEQKKTHQGGSTPPESTFRKLAPSRNRYTLLKDEL